MNKLIGILTLIAVAAMLVSCREEPCIKCIDEQQKMERLKNRIELRLTACPATKVADVVAEDESAIHSAILFVFDSQTGILLSKHRDSVGIFSITLADGLYDFAAVVNAPDVNPSTVSEFNSTVSALSDNRKDSFVMVGLERNIDIVTSRTIPVSVRRIVSKVNYSITVDWDNPVYDNTELLVKGAYMSNVCGDVTYGNTSYEVQNWYNRMFYSVNDMPTLLFGSETCLLKNGDNMNSVHTFYVYPNGSTDNHDKEVFSPRCTRLVIETRFNNEVYYYPITLPNIKPNTAYDVKLKVRGPGMEHPEDENIAAGSIEVVIGVIDWETGEKINAEF